MKLGKYESKRGVYFSRSKKSYSSIVGLLYHGNIIRTGVTCKKIRCYMRDSASRWLIVENDKIFRSYVKYF